MFALITGEARFYQEAVAELKRRGLHFMSLEPGVDIPPNVDIVITSEREVELIPFKAVVSGSTAIEAVTRAVRLKEGLKKRYSQITIGIDPGKRIGVAALGDNRSLFEEVLTSPEEVVKAVKKIEGSFQAGETVVKVGSAGGLYRNRIISNLQAHFNYPVEVVDEGSTTGDKSVSRRLGIDKDVLAARKIARKEGKLLKGLVEIKTTPGELKNIQRESRRQSGNITVSINLAEAVAKGEINLDEAIRRQRNGGRE